MSVEWQHGGEARRGMCVGGWVGVWMEKAYQLEVDVNVSIGGTSDCRFRVVRTTVCPWS